MKIQRPGIASALVKFLRLTGATRLELENFVLPIIQVGDLSGGEPPPVWRHAVSSFTVAAVALERPIWQWQIPGSAIAVLKRLNVRPTTTVQNLRVNFGRSLPDSAFTSRSVTEGFTDGRVEDTDPAAVLNFDTQVDPIASQFTLAVNPAPDNRMIIPPDGWVLGTGDVEDEGVIEFSMDGLNEAVAVVMEWTEYQIV